MKLGQDIRPLTGLRGLAALYVMTLHYVAGEPMTRPFNTVLTHGYLAVDLFFILSGFVMALSYGYMFESGWGPGIYLRFLGRRIARIYPLYAAMTVLAFVLIVLKLNHGALVDSMPVALGLNLLMVQSWGLVASLDGPSWSISAEWAAYLLFPAILVPCLFRGAGIACVSAVISIGVVAVLCSLPADWAAKLYPDMLMDLHVPTMGLPVLRCLPEFALGVLTFRASRMPIAIGLATRQSVALAICGAIVVFLAIPKADFWVVLLFPVLILSLTSDRHLPGRLLASGPIELLGRLSYSIYLTHDLMFGAMGCIRRFVEGLGLHHGQSYAAVAGAAMTLAFSSVCFNFIEQPGRRWLRHAFEGRRAFPIVAEPSAP